jgi:CRISPR-associated protein Csb2
MIEIVVHLVRRSYEASDSSHTAVEWPPHPARLFGALVDAADLDNESHRNALGLLEQAQPPRIFTSECTTSNQVRTNYVVSNDVVKESKYGTIPLRVAPGTRSWPRVMMSEPEICFVWNIQPGDEETIALNDICKRVGYFGRSTSPAIVRCKTYEPDQADNHKNCWRPITGIGSPLRTPTPGYLALLERAFQNGMSAHEAPSAEVEYGLHDVGPIEQLPNTGYETTFAMKSFARSIDSRRTLELTTLIRRAFLAHLEKDLPKSQQPAALCGHANLGETSWKQVMFVALTHVAHQHADGTIKGLAMILPSGLERKTRAHALKAWRAITELTLGSRGVALLTDTNDETNGRIRALRSSRWTKEASVWTTVTPIVPTKYCTSNAQKIRYVQETCEAAGLPVPEVEILKVPVNGALRLRADESKRHSTSFSKPNFHVTMRFPTPVSGPLVLGDMSHYGLGLCVQVGETTE